MERSDARAASQYKEYIEEVTTNHISNGNFRIFL